MKPVKEIVDLGRETIDDEPSVPEAEIAAFVAGFKTQASADGSGASGPAARLVEAGDARINVLSLGEGPGLPLVLVHGFGGDLDSWLFNQAALAAGRTTHAIDLPSHGASPIADMAGGVPSLAKTIIATLDALGLAKVHLVGHSLGGAIAIWLGKSEPGRIASLTLIAPGGIGSEICTAFLEGFAKADKRKEMKEALGLLFADAGAVSRDMVENALKYKRLDGASAALTALLATMLKEGRQRSGLREILPALQPPTQIIWGTKDHIIPVEQAKGLPPTIAVHLLEGIGHMPQMEAANEVNRLIREHAERNGG